MESFESIVADLWSQYLSENNASKVGCWFCFEGCRADMLYNGACAECAFTLVISGEWK